MLLLGLLTQLDMFPSFRDTFTLALANARGLQRAWGLCVRFAKA